MTEKRTRRTRAELRELMLTAGKEVLYDIDPTIGFQHLTYATVFSHLLDRYDQKVTIGSVHERLWASQRDFQLDVIGHALQDALPMAPDAALLQATEVIGGLDLSTPERRRYAIQSAVRNTSHLLSEPESSPSVELAYTVRLRLWEMGPNHPEAAGLRDAITEIRAQATDQYEKTSRQIMALIGLRVRADAGDPDEAVRSIAILGNAARVGLRTDPLAEAHQPRLLPTGPGGELEEWHADALALWAVVRTTLELDGEDLSDAERAL